MLDPLFLIPTKGITWWGGEGRDLLRALMWDAAGVGCRWCGMQRVRDAVVEHHYTASLAENETPSFMSGRSWSTRGLREL